MERREISQQIKNELEKTSRIRKKERDFKEGMGSSKMISSRDDVKNKIAHILGPDLAPRNIGELAKVSWPFFYELTFDFSVGSDTIFIKDKAIKDSVQISQEAGFLATKIYRDWDDVGLAGMGAPLLVDLRDNSSSRQLNDNAFMIQHLGNKGRPTHLPLPFVVAPNASMTIKMTPWIDKTIVNSKGKTTIIVEGLRVRKEGMEQVLRELIKYRRNV